jgi:hypothetical protein
MNTIIRFSLLFALLVALVPRVVPQAQAEPANPLTTAALEATADTTLVSATPSTNYGASSPLILGTGEFAGYQRILLQFDMAELPANIKTVTRAYLYLYQNSHLPSTDAPMFIAAHHVTAPWSEQIATWSNSTNKVGAQRGSAVLPRDTNFYEIDITGLAEDWRTGRLDNFGVVLIGHENLSIVRQRTFAAREGSAPFRPRLFFEYEAYNDTSPPVVTITPMPNSALAPFTVSWGGYDVGEAGIATYDVQYRQDLGEWQNWVLDTTATSRLFDTAVVGAVYQFRARGVDRAGNVEEFGAAEATLIYGYPAPHATVSTLPSITKSGTFVVAWTRYAPPGWEITGVGVNYRFFNSTTGQWTAWTEWLPNTNDTVAFFTALQDGQGNYIDGLYQFEAAAYVSGGVLQDGFTGTAEASTFLDLNHPFITPRLWLPLVVR